MHKSRVKYPPRECGHIDGRALLFATPARPPYVYLNVPPPPPLSVYLDGCVFFFRWVKVLSMVTEEERQERNLSRTASEPDIQMLGDHEVRTRERHGTAQNTKRALPVTLVRSCWVGLLSLSATGMR